MKTKPVCIITFTFIIAVIILAVATADVALAVSWIVIGLIYYFLVKTETEFEEYRKSHESPNPEH